MFTLGPLVFAELFLRIPKLWKLYGLECYGLFSNSETVSFLTWVGSHGCVLFVERCRCAHNVSLLYIQRLLLKILFKRKRKKEILGPKGKGKATRYTFKYKFK